MKKDREEKNLVPGSFLPSSTYPEAILETIQNISSLVPVLGGPISNIFGGMAADRKFERIREVMVGVAQELSNLNQQVSEEYVRSEDFEDLLDETLRRVARERYEEKRRIYQRFLAREIAEPIEYDSQILILRALEELQVADLAVLEVMLREPAAEESKGLVAGSIIGTFRRRFPGTDDRVIKAAVDRLDRLRITDNVSQMLMTIMTPQGARDLRPRLTDFGRSLAKYLNPVDSRTDVFGSPALFSEV